MEPKLSAVTVGQRVYVKRFAAHGKVESVADGVAQVKLDKSSLSIPCKLRDLAPAKSERERGRA